MRSAEVTPAKMKASIDQTAFDKLDDKVKAGYKVFNWHFATDKDAQSNVPSKRIGHLEGYIRSELTDDERAELDNVRVRRTLRPKDIAVQKLSDQLTKCVRQNFKHIDKATAGALLKDLTKFDETVDMLTRILNDEDNSSGASKKEYNASF
jgi:hypothetical protein